jgi:hypothetical protein
MRDSKGMRASLAEMDPMSMAAAIQAVGNEEEPQLLLLVTYWSRWRPAQCSRTRRDRSTSLGTHRRSLQVGRTTGRQDTGRTRVSAGNLWV